MKKKVAIINIMKSRLDYTKNKFKLFLLFLSIFFLIFTYYKSEVIFNGELQHYYLNYYILGTILFVIAILFFFINETLFFYIKSTLIYLVFSVYVGEIFFLLQNYYSYKNELNFKKKTLMIRENLEFDERTKFEYYNYHKNEINPKAVVTIQPNNHISKYLEMNQKFELLPLSGISNRETIYANENGYWSKYKSDRYGFNNSDELWDQKEIDYLVSGDSFAHGSAVHFDEGIAAVINKISNKKAITIGYGGNGPLLRHASVKEYLKTQIKFKKVLWLYLEGDDLFNLKNEMKTEILLKYFENDNFSQNLISKQEEIDSINYKFMNTEEINYLNFVRKELSEKKKSKYIFSVIKLNRLRGLIFKSNDATLFRSNKLIGNQEYSFFKELLKKEKNFLKKNNSELIFVYIPEFRRYDEKNYDQKSYLKI